MQSKQAVILGFYRDGKGIRALARDLDLSRGTVRKYLREYADYRSHLGDSAGTTELVEDLVSAPSYDSSRRSRRKVTREVLELIEGLLAENRLKRSRGQSKQQMKKIDIYERVKSAGYGVGYTTICGVIRELSSSSREGYIKQSYPPGEVAEFDWGEVKVFIGDKLCRLQLAVFTTAYGNYRYGRLFYKQDTASFQQAHALFFDHVGGVHRELVYDNMRTVVKRFVGSTEKEATTGLLQLSLYYQFHFRFCNVRRGNEKGHVERSVEYVRRKAFGSADQFESLAAANQHLLAICEGLNQRPQKACGDQTAADFLAEEKAHLLPSPPLFECGQLRELRVDKYSTVTVDTCHYSVPDRYVGEILAVKVYPARIVVYAGHQRICVHEKRHGAYEWVIDLDHYLTTLDRKPGALAGSVALSQTEPRLKAIYEQYFPDDPKGFIELLHYRLDRQKSLAEIEAAIVQLSRLSPKSITAAAIQLICDRQPVTAPIPEGHIERQSQAQLYQLARLFPQPESFDRQEVIS